MKLHEQPEVEQRVMITTPGDPSDVIVKSGGKWVFTTGSSLNRQLPDGKNVSVTELIDGHAYFHGGSQYSVPESVAKELEKLR